MLSVTALKESENEEGSMGVELSISYISNNEHKTSIGERLQLQTVKAFPD